MQSITVYVPITYLNMIQKSTGQLPRPDEFWLSKPDSWRTCDIGTMTISLETWKSWNKEITDGKTSSKQLLNG